MYDSGQGVPQNYDEAFKWYSKAANQGDAMAQNNLGLMYQNGQAVQRDDVEAYKWYCLSASQGNKHAITNRDVLLSSLTPEQIAEGQHRGANPKPNSDSVAAAEFERDFYERYPDLKPYTSLLETVALKLQASGFRGESRDAVMEKSASETRKEVERRHGQQARERNQTPQTETDPLKASAERGDVQAQTRLGWMYYNGQGVPQSWEKALKWYSKAAEQGDGTAQNNLGVMYALPVAVALDDDQTWRGDGVEAYKWYSISAAGGNTNAIANRDTLLRSLTPEQVADGERRARGFRVTKQSSR